MRTYGILTRLGVKNEKCVRGIDVGKGYCLMKSQRRILFITRVKSHFMRQRCRIDDLEVLLCVTLDITRHNGGRHDRYKYENRYKESKVNVDFHVEFKAASAWVFPWVFSGLA